MCIYIRGILIIKMRHGGDTNRKGEKGRERERSRDDLRKILLFFFFGDNTKQAVLRVQLVDNKRNKRWCVGGRVLKGKRTFFGFIFLFLQGKNVENHL
jgi:hypothetical protein